MLQEMTTQVLHPGTKLRSKEHVYEIVKVLGSGSFGITYLATAQISIGNISTTMKFAIKEHFMSASCYRGDDGVTVLSVPSAKSSVVDSRADFITEANRLETLCLKSRNIVSVNETFEANGTAYYVMEFLDGGSPSRCSEDDAVSIVMQIANALNEIHMEKVLHLDIKPDNIVLKENDRGETYPVLIDFGISKHFDSKGRPTSSFSAKGASSGYAPQEQYADVTEFSPKYDIYALGAVLFFLCTGKNPPDAFKISPNQQELKKELAGKVSSKVEKAILNAMKPAALERTSSIKQFCDDLMGIDFVPVLNVSNTELDFSKEKGQHSVSVESNIGWTVYAKEDWCRVSKDGNNVIISASKNRETGSRICDVVVNGLTYQISRVIHVKQKGSGTVVFPHDPTWWELNKKRIYQAGGVILTGCCIAGLCVLLKANSEEESRRLTAAIETMNGPELKKFAERDSVRAYLPYAQFLFKGNDYENAEIYATKAISSGDSINAASLLRDMQTLSMTIGRPTDVAHVTDHDIPIDPHKPEIFEQDQTEPVPEVREETNDEKFARASNDISLMLTLAKNNYAKSYYPLAVMYFERNDVKSTKYWAQKAINANVNSKQAQTLLLKIVPQTPSYDELFAKAKSLADFKALADKGYKKAYAPLAELYLTMSIYDEAHQWAVKAGNAKVGLDQARKVINILDAYGYYANDERPEF